MEILLEFITYFLKVITTIIAVVFCIIVIVGIGQKKKNEQQTSKLNVLNLNKKYFNFALKIKLFGMSKRKSKAYKKKALEEQKKIVSEYKKRLFVLNFKGDAAASGVKNLREEISSIISIAEKDDEVLLFLESAGGLVSSYGHASAQLNRIKQAGIKLTVSVDEVAASGGYMMACIADKLIAAPFSIIGSIGVIAQFPNFNRLLNKLEVSVEEHTSGEYKRTLSMFNENDDKGRNKFKQGLNDVHDQFKEHVLLNRPQLVPANVMNGDDWSGLNAKRLGLIDEVAVSDDVLLGFINSGFKCLSITHTTPKPMSKKIGIRLAKSLESFVMNFIKNTSNKSSF